MSKPFAAVLVLCLSMAAPLVHAKPVDKRLPYKPTESELQSLPDYCQARLAGDKEAQRQWALKMGKDIYMHLHHFCTGLTYASRAQFAFGSRHRGYYLQTALSEFNYVLRNWPPNFELTVEAQAQKERLELLVNKR